MCSNLPTEYELVTHYIKIYPDRLKLIQFRTPYSSFVQNKEFRKSDRIIAKTEEERAEILENSITRTKTILTDLTICNSFDLFVTFTLNCRACVPRCSNRPCTCDIATCKRYDLAYAIRTQKAWYNNQVKRYRRWPYLQVMELHDKGGYHFHALFSHYPGRLKFAKRDKDGRAIYNLESYRKGFTTAKKIYDLDGTSSYVRKYIAKNMPTFPGKKRIWVSNNLRRPIVTKSESLREAIIHNHTTQVYVPKRKVKIKGSSVITSNLESIRTLMVGQESPYYQILKELTAINSVFKGAKYDFDTFDPLPPEFEVDD